MTIAMGWLWWVGGAVTALAVAGWSRHKAIGIALLVVGVVLTIFAFAGKSVTVNAPQVHSSPSAVSSSGR